MVNQPQVKAIIGDFKICEKMAQFDNKKYAEMQSKLKGGEKKVSTVVFTSIIIPLMWWENFLCYMIM